MRERTTFATSVPALVTCRFRSIKRIEISLRNAIMGSSLRYTRVSIEMV